MDANKIALVTGANKGLGFEISRQLAKQGIHVLIGCRDAKKGNQAVEELKREKLAIELLHLDVSNSRMINDVVEEIRKRFGKLDILVNNAGISSDEGSEPNSSASVSPGALRRTFDVNFFGLVELTQALLPLLRKSDAARIVNMSSILGSLEVHSKEGMSYKPLAYDASKTAVNAFTIHLAAALAKTPIKVNSAHPGWVRTDMGGPNAPLSPAEGAKTAVWLATLGPDGPTGKFFQGREELPW